MISYSFVRSVNYSLNKINKLVFKFIIEKLDFQKSVIVRKLALS